MVVLISAASATLMPLSTARAPKRIAKGEVESDISMPPRNPSAISPRFISSNPPKCLRSGGGRLVFRTLGHALFLAHQIQEPGKEVVAVLGAGAGFGVILHREDRLAIDGEAGVGIVEERDVRLGDASRQAFGVDSKAMVHRGDFHLAGG